MTEFRRRLLITVCLAIAGAAGQASAAAQTAPLLEVLRESGSTRDGVPVLERDPEGARYAAALTRGLSGRLLHLYALEQRYLQLKNGTVPEPAYLLVSRRSGGFPRFGFYLGSLDKRSAGYVDLRGQSRIGGGFGSMDQIFPHELAHVILVQLAGPPRHGGSNQLHAVGVRTDQFNAFSEGFAEHFQVLAVDDADALPETRELLRDSFFERRADMQLREYAAEMRARWPVPGRRRLCFPFWFSGNEQALRYYAVRRNAFARHPEVADRLVAADPYRAYLLENVLPGGRTDPRRTPAQMIATEGVVASFFLAMAGDTDLRNARRDAAFYEAFGVEPATVTPFENVYLKLFHAFFVTRPADLPQAIAGYRAVFPDDAPALDRIVRAVSLGQSFDTAEPLWLANEDFSVGTSVFDQFRSMPRVHTFDLNAASLADLASVPGVSRQLADAIRRGGPYRSVSDLRRARGMTTPIVERFAALERRARARQANAADEESSLSIAGILRPFVWRLGLLVAVAVALGAAAYRLAATRSWPHAIFNATAGVVVGLFAEAALDFPPGVLAVVAPVLVLGVPAALYCLLFPKRTAARTRIGVGGSGRPSRIHLALSVLFAWALVPMPLVVLITPHF